MPDFANAEIATGSPDLTAYRTFLKKLEVGQTVTLPLEEGDTSRKVMRALNSAAAQNNMRITRIQSPNGSVRFRVVSPEKRTVTLTDEAKRVRVEKAKATRAARKQELAQLGNMGMGEVAVSEMATPAPAKSRRQTAASV